MVMAFRLLFGQLPLFAALVLTIWVPGHLLIDMAVAGNPNQADTLVVLQLGQLIELVFGPIYAAGIITALAARMSGEKMSYLEAMRQACTSWGACSGPGSSPPPVRAPWFDCPDHSGAHPGNPFHADRRGRGPRESRWKSRQAQYAAHLGQGAADLSGPGWSGSRLMMTFSLSLAKLGASRRLPTSSLVADACDCLSSVFAVFFNCLLFLYYWEARQQEANAESEKYGKRRRSTRRLLIRCLHRHHVNLIPIMADLTQKTTGEICRRAVLC